MLLCSIIYTSIQHYIHKYTALYTQVYSIIYTSIQHYIHKYTALYTQVYGIVFTYIPAVVTVLVVKLSVSTISLDVEDFSNFSS